MTRDEARRKLEDIARPKAVQLEVGDRLSSEEKRAAANAAVTTANIEIAVCNDRIAEIIAAHVELQSLYAKRRALRKTVDALNSESRYYKFRACKEVGAFFVETLGVGDTWEQVVTQATERAKRKG